MLSGAHVQPGRAIGEASIYDVAPTVLALFGQPVPRSWPGQVLGQALDPEFLERQPVRYLAEDPVRSELRAGAGEGPVDPAAADLMKKLQSLGYVSSGSAGETSISASNNAGVALMADGQYAEAEAAFREGLAERPNSPSLIVNLALALRFQGRVDEARDLLLQAFEYVSTRRVAGHTLAQISLERSELDEAERYLRTVLRGEPGAAEVRTSLGVVLEKRGDLEGAEAAWRRAVELDRNAAKPRNHLGTLARRRGDSQQAERWFLQAIEADPYFMGAYNNLALVYQDRGEMKKAIDLYSRALTKAPSNAVVLNNLASLYYAEGDLEQAGKLWRRSVGADPSYPSPLNNLAGLEIGRQRYDEAERLLQQALQLEPGYGDARINLALVHRARGESDAARKQLEQAAQDPRSRRQALSQLGLLEFEQGRYETAAAALAEARDGGARGIALLNVLGESYRQLNRNTEAAEAWRASLALDPGQEQLRSRLADLER